MPIGAQKRFVLLAIAVALTPLVLLPWAIRFLGESIGWALTGWMAIAVIGVVAGGALVKRHGEAGHGFMVALVAGMLARLAVASLGGFFAMLSGESAIWSFMGGVTAGFLPVQAFELAWFYKASRKLAAGTWS
jgi:hypothetical protein